MQNMIPPRWRVATLNNGGRDVLEDMTAIIKEHVAITNHDLQHLEENGREMETVTKNTMEMSQE